jgi:hypothetical protein
LPDGLCRFVELPQGREAGQNGERQATVRRRSPKDRVRCDEHHDAAAPPVQNAHAELGTHHRGHAVSKPGSGDSHADDRASESKAGSDAGLICVRALPYPATWLETLAAKPLEEVSTNSSFAAKKT